MYKYLLILLIGVTGWSSIALGQFTDGYLDSIDLAPSPTNTYILSTDGTDNQWIANTGGGAGGSGVWSTTTGNLLIYNNTGDQVLISGNVASATTTDAILEVLGDVSASYYTATDTAATSTLPNLSVTTAINLLGTYFTDLSSFLFETELDTEAELETQLTDVSNVFTNNDGTLADDDLSDNSTTDLSEGTNLYYTAARVIAELINGNDAIFDSATTTNATSTNFAISNLLTFNGVTGSAWTDFCVAITGGSGLCDGNDATGGGGSGGSVATSTPDVDTYVTFFTSNSATPATIGGEAAFTYDDATDLLTFINGSSTDLTVSGNLWADLTGNADTATALAANGSNCSAGNSPLGVDASGAVESCFDVWTEAENTAAAYLQGNETITLSGDVSGSGATSITALIGNDIVDYLNIDNSATLAGNLALETNDAFFGDNGILFEGATADTFEGLLTTTVGTSDKTWTLPNATGDIAVTSGTGIIVRTGAQTHANRTITGSTNDVAVSNGSGASGNPTLTFARAAAIGSNPSLAASAATFGSTGIVYEGSSADTIEGLLTWPTITSSDKTITLPDSSGTVALLDSAMTGTYDGNNFGDGVIGTNQMLYGSSAGTFGEIAAGTSGQLLQANGSGVPTFVSMSGDASIAAGGALTIGSDKILESMLKAVDAAVDEECLTYESTTGDFEWQTCAAGGSSEWTDAGTSVYPTEPTDQVAIGTTTVSSLSTLTVAATSSDTTSILSLLNENQTEVFSVEDDGSIVTTSNQELRFKNSAGGVVAYFFDETSGGTNTNYVYGGNAEAGSPPYFTSTGGDTNIDLQFFAKGAGTIYFGDNTGIGTSTAEAELDVWGDSGSTIVQFVSDTGTKFMEMLNTGVTTFLGTVDMIGAILQVGEVTYDSQPDSDHTASGPIVSDIAASTTIAIGDLVHLNTVGAWELADADATSTVQGLLGISIEAQTNGNDMDVALDGAFIRDDSWNWSIGVPLYASTTAGTITETAPTASGDSVRVIGYAVTADVIKIEPGVTLTLQ